MGKSKTMFDRGAREELRRRFESIPPERRLVSLPSILDAMERLPAFTRLVNTLPAPRAELPCPIDRHRRLGMHW